VPIAGVERAPLVLAHDAHGDFSVRVQRVSDPARHSVPGQQGAVLRGVARELQREREVLQGHLQAKLASNAYTASACSYQID